MSGLVIWITGLPGSGKSTLADSVRERFPDFILLRMDDMRKELTPEPTYSPEERDLLYRCLVYTAKTLSGLGHNVLIDATGNLRRWRELARLLIPKFAEIYLSCPLEICVQREAGRKDTRGAPRDIYGKGRRGAPVPGLGAPYEEPLGPELTLDVGNSGVQQALETVTKFIKSKMPEGK